VSQFQKLRDKTPSTVRPRHVRLHFVVSRPADVSRIISSFNGQSEIRDTTMALLQEDDDFFGDHDDDDHHEEHPNLMQCTDGHELHSGLAVAEAKSSQSRYQKLGYHAAYDEHKDLNVQDGFEAGYKEVYNHAFKIGEMLGEATMKHKLSVKGKTATPKSDKITPQGVVNDDDKEAGQRDPAYLVAAKKVRGVLTDTEDKEESSKKSYDLRDLQREIEHVLKP
jgi:hypothetical protein